MEVSMKGTGEPLLMVYTGNGKGKTSAAMGQMMRALGHGGKCAVAQFIKGDPEKLDLGEWRCATQTLGVTWRNFGVGFTWAQDSLEPTAAECRKGWEQVKRWISTGVFDMIILDEFTYALSMGLVDPDEVLMWIADHKGKSGFPHLVITGRNAPERLVKLADMVSEVVEVKHHMTVQGKKAAPMVEF
jgi:cob(I)alamin adenosyltransferase